MNKPRASPLNRPAHMLDICRFDAAALPLFSGNAGRNRATLQSHQ
jgi:hypothetical protein